ncbi:hypothetical protein VR41_09060 [Streptomyces sp. NRRL B-1568]|nr:hypothetical protein VR41_09060 [Streptomyces sp. NRRL B-1568]
MPLCPYTGHTGGGLPSTTPQTDPIEDVIRLATATDRWLPAPGHLRGITDRLQVYIRATTQIVEAAVSDRPSDDPLRKEALAAVAEARYRLRIGPGNGYSSAIIFARSLGRAAEELYRHRHGGGPAVAVAGSAGAAVTVLPPSEKCPMCLGLVQERRQAELHSDWTGMRAADARLARHRSAEHAEQLHAPVVVAEWGESSLSTPPPFG